MEGVCVHIATPTKNAFKKEGFSPDEATAEGPSCNVIAARPVGGVSRGELARLFGEKESLGSTESFTGFFARACLKGSAPVSSL